MQCLHKQHLATLGNTSKVLSCSEKRFHLMPAWELRHPPAPKVLGRDLPDGTRKRLQVYLGGGAFFGQNLLFLIGRDARLQKTL